MATREVMAMVCVIPGALFIILVNAIYNVHLNPDHNVLGSLIVLLGSLFGVSFTLAWILDPRK